MYKEALEYFADLGILQKGDDYLAGVIVGLHEAKPGEAIGIVAGECAGLEWRHAVALREMVMAAKRGVNFTIIAGPVLATEPFIQTEFRRNKKMLGVLQEWLTPLTEIGIVSTEMIKDKGRYRLQVEGPESTVKSLGELVFIKVPEAQIGAESVVAGF